MESGRHDTLYILDKEDTREVGVCAPPKLVDHRSEEG